MDGDNLTTRKIGEVLYQDFVLVLYVLQMCNSCYYGIFGKIDSFETALSYIGADRFPSNLFEPGCNCQGLLHY
jgi:HD-like signal output (HDOD) protein